MKSLYYYTTNKTNYNFDIFENFDTYIKNYNIPINESQFIENNTNAITSVFNKMHSYIHNYGKLNESHINSYDIYLTTKEQTAMHDFMYLTTAAYMKSLLLESGYISEYEINEMEMPAVFGKIKEFVKDKAQSAKEGFNNIKGKFKQLYDFLITLSKEGFKSIKDIAWKFVDMMLAFGCKIDDLMTKLKVDRNKAIKALIKKIKTVFKDKKTQVNIFEEENNSKEENNGDEYGDGWFGLIGKALFLIFINAIAYTAVCVFIPAIVTIIGGPLAGALAESIAKIFWSSNVVFHQIRAEHKLHKSGDFNKKYNTPFKRLTHYVFFTLNIFFASIKLIEGFGSFGNIIKAIADGNKGNVIPSEVVQKWAGKINDFYKNVFDKNTSGWEELNKITTEHEQGVWEIKSQETKYINGKECAGLSPEQAKSEFENNHFNSSTEAIHYFTDKGMNSEAILKLSDKDKITCMLDGYFAPGKNDWSNDLLKAWKDFGNNPNELYDIINHGKNMGLHNMCKNAGSMTGALLPADFIKYCLNHNISLGNKGACAFLGTEDIAGELAIITKRVLKHTPIIQNFDWLGPLSGGVLDYFDGAFTSIPFKDKDNTFRLRLGDKKSGNYIYEFNTKNIKLEKSNIDEEKYKALIDSNNKFHEQLKKIEDKKQKEKSLEIYNEFMESFNKNIKDIQNVVLYGKLIDKGKEEEKKESYVSLYDYIINEGLTNDQINKLGKNIKNTKLIKEPLKDLLFESVIFESEKQEASVKQNLIALYKLFNDNKADELLSMSDYDDDKLKELEDKYKELINKYKSKIEKYIDLKHTHINVKNKEFNIRLKSTKSTDLKKLRKELNSITTNFNDEVKELLSPNKEQVNTNLEDIKNNDDKKKLLDKATKTSNKIKDILSKWKDKLKEYKLDENDLLYVNAMETFTLWQKNIILYINNNNLKEKDIDDYLEKSLQIIEFQYNEAVKSYKALKNNKVTVEKPSKKPSEKPSEEPSETSNKNGITLMFTPLCVCGFDVDNANSKGPRTYTYTLKGLYNSLEFIPTQNGMSENDFNKMIGEYLKGLIKENYKFVLDKPCSDTDKNYTLSFEASMYKENEPRADFGNLSNKEITDILNNKIDIKKILDASSTNSIAENPNEQEKQKKFKAEAEENCKDKAKKEKIENKLKQSTELKKKYINGDTIDYDKLYNDLGTFKLAQQKAKAKKENKGLFSKLVNAVKSLFGSNKAEKEMYSLYKTVYNESYDYLQYTMTNYIIENNHKTLKEYLYTK